MIEIKAVSKNYLTGSLSVCALNDIELKLPNKGFVALYGENGCGKTTLLNIISTIDTKYSGEVTFNSLPYRGNEEYLRRNVLSYVLQDEYFIDGIDITRNLELFCEDKELDSLQAMLDSYQLSDKASAMPCTLSGGQKRRISFMRGIIKQSEVLLVDEPTSSLNEEMEEFVFQEMKAISKDKLVVLVSHNKRLINNYCDLAIHMDKGKIVKTEDIGCRINSVIYHDDYIEVPAEDFDFGLLDDKQTKKIMERTGKITVKKSENIQENKKLDYSKQDIAKSSELKRLKKDVKQALFISSIKKNIISFLIFGFLIGFIAMIFAYSVSFYNFSPAEFTFESLNRNEYAYFDLKNQSMGKPLNESDYYALRNDFNADIIITEEIYFSQLDFENNGIYQNTVHRVAYCETQDVELLYGRFPLKNSEILITDYIADGLISSNNTKYASYEDVISKDIICNFASFKVSGIINTEYEKYEPCYNSDEFRQSKNYIDYEYKRQNEFAVIYYSYSAVQDSEYISNLPIEYGTYFVDMETIDEDLTAQSCFINNELNNLLDKKSNFNYIKIGETFLNIAGVIDDDCGLPKMYVKSEELENIKKSLLSSVSSLNVKLNSVETVEYLLARYFYPNSSSSSYIMDTINIISLLQNFFVVLLLILLIIMIGIVLFDTVKFLNKQNKMFAFMKLAGYKKTDMLLYTFLLTAVNCFVAVVFSCLMFIFSALILNAVLSDIFNATIALANVSFVTVLITCVTLVVIYIIAWYIVTMAKNKKDIIKLLKG